MEDGERRGGWREEMFRDSSTWAQLEWDKSSGPITGFLFVCIRVCVRVRIYIYIYINNIFSVGGSAVDR